MAKRGDYSTDTKFPSYEKGSQPAPGTDGEKDSLGAKADGPLGSLGKLPSYLSGDFTQADMAAGACAYDMPYWSDPPLPMAIGRIEAGKALDANDNGDLTDGSDVFHDQKHKRIRQGVETPAMINGEGSEDY
jgi:hypothetical protein